MDESDYILATNLQKFRIICDLLHDCLPDRGVDEVQLTHLYVEATAIRDGLFVILNAEDGESSA